MKNIKGYYFPSFILFFPILFINQLIKFMSKYKFIQTNANCQNKSSSKQLYSFPKKQRFSEKVRNNKSGSGFILPPSFISEKAKGPSFSRSEKKMRFENEQEYISHPSPDSYNNWKKKQSQGFTIGIKLRSVSKQKQSKNPGPTSYSLDRLKHAYGIKFTKQARQTDKEVKSITPGPYFIKTEKLNSILSTYKNSKQVRIVKKIEPLKNTLLLKEKLQKMKNQNQSSLKKMHLKYPSSFGRSIAYRNQKSISLSRDLKRSCFDIKEKTPGPGHYDKFSQFGERIERVAKLQKISPIKRSCSSSRNLQTLPLTRQKTKTTIE